MTVTWAASNADKVQVSITGKKSDGNGGEMADSYEVDSSDDGTEVITKDRYASWTANSVITVIVRRINNGTFATSLKGGSIRGVQSHSVTVGLSGSPSLVGESQAAVGSHVGEDSFAQADIRESALAQISRDVTENKRCR